MQDQKQRDANYSIAIIGSGAFAQGLAKICEHSRLYQFYYICFGTSKIQDHDANVRLGKLSHIPVYPTSQALENAQIVILAIPFSAQQSFAQSFSKQLRGKIIVEVSNPGTQPLKRGEEYTSAAERLQQQLPQSTVVKALNNLSSYALLSSSTFAKHLNTTVAGEIEAAETIQKVLQLMGINSNVVPSLRYSKGMETSQLKFFEDWLGAIGFYLFCWFFLIIYCEVGYQVTSDPKYPGFAWKDMALWRPSLITGDHAMFLFASVYMIGPILFTIKWFRGGEEFKLPKIIFWWMKSRKQIGLLAALDLVIHVLGLEFRFVLQPLPVYTDKQVTEGIETIDQVQLLFGCIAAMALIPILIASLPNQNLQWREWHFLQQTVGNFLMCCIVIHSMLHSYSNFKYNRYTFKQKKANPNGLFPMQYFSNVPAFVTILFIFIRFVLSGISLVCRGNPLRKVKQKKEKTRDFSVYVWEV